MHPKVSQALEEIDAQLFNGETTTAELSMIKAYVESWQRRIIELEKEIEAD